MSCLPKSQDDSLCLNTSLKAHTLVTALQRASVFNVPLDSQGEEMLLCRSNAVQRTTCEHEAWQQPYPQFAWFYLLKVVACSEIMLFLVPKNLVSRKTAARLEQAEPL